MQPSEIFRIGIVLPLTKETEFQLRSGYIDDVIEVKFLPLKQEDFYSMWKTGLFKEINHSQQIQINEYEDEYLEANCLEPVLNIVQKYMSKNNDEKLVELLNRLYSLIKQGEGIKMPVYFIF